MWSTNLYPDIFFTNGVLRTPGINHAIKFINPIERTEIMLNIEKKNEEVKQNIDTIINANKLEKQFSDTQDIQGSGLQKNFINRNLGSKSMSKKPTFSFNPSKMNIQKSVTRNKYN